MDTFGEYLKTISKWPLLTPAQEIDLGRLVQAGIETSERIGNRKPNRKESRAIRTGKRSLDRMVLCNLRLVVSVAKLYAGSCRLLDIEDLIQYGSIGLKRAAEKFDPTRGYKFSTYARRWIEQGIRRGIYETDLSIRLPEHCHADWRKVQRQARELAIALSRAPATIEAVRASGVSEKNFSNIAKAMHPIISLNVQSENGGEMINNLANPSNSDEAVSADYECLLASIRALPENDQDLIARRFGIGGYSKHDFIELGQQCGLSRQGMAKKIGKIQDQIKAKLLEQMQ
jgi:RNA polymerase primary sigma factor